MIIKKIASLLFITVAFNSCNTAKKTTTPALASIVPGEAQLTAIKAKYPDVTAEQLSEGHSIFIGACTNCHGQYNIYKRSEASWLHEIDDMSPKAKLTDSQKDALTKYVLAMKATQVVDPKK
jgi:mono/diheme cytochrome c family protein